MSIPFMSITNVEEKVPHKSYKEEQGQYVFVTVCGMNNKLLVKGFY